MPKRISRGKLGYEMSPTKIGAIFIRARNGRPLRVVETLTGVNRETWRRIEIGKTERPGPEMLHGAATLAGAPPYEDFRAALEEDARKSYAPQEVAP